jgi:hypothetical protein
MIENLVPAPLDRPVPIGLAVSDLIEIIAEITIAIGAEAKVAERKANQMTNPP